ncbi:MAG: hypothetical protein IJY73_02555 [Oscillospiraceae bacterium]|nr:hypothetical protein [Oscillospiraceae bacterium]
MESEDPVYVPIKEIAQKYLIRYHEHMEKSINQFIGNEPELIIEAVPQAEKTTKKKANESVEALARLREGSGQSSASGEEKEYSSLELAKKVAAAPKPKHKEN